MTDIAIIGAGRVGQNLAAGLAAAGYTVTLGTTAAPQLPDGVAAAPIPDAAAAAPLVISALPGDVAVEVLSQLREQLEGKILLDIGNATQRAGDRPGALLYPDSSLAEELQRALPATAVVKSLNTMLYPVMTNPSLIDGPAGVFLSGDNEDAKASVRNVLNRLGWRDDRITDLGLLPTARAVEAVVQLVPHVLQARGMQPFAITAVS